MYTGNYYPKEEGMRVPLDYSGSTFGDDESRKINERSGSRDEGITETMAEMRGDGILGSLASLFPIGRILPDGMRNAFHLENFKIGTEELLIIALAMFLFLSKDGDKECAIILFLLLFIN